MDYKEFYSEKNVLHYAHRYANDVYDDHNTSRQIDNLLYKLRIDIRCDDITKAQSLLKRNFDIYLNLQYRIQRERIRSDDFRELRQDYGLFFDKCQRLEQENMKLKEDIEILQNK